MSSRIAERHPTGLRAWRTFLCLILAAIGARAASPADQEWKSAFESARAQKRLVFVDYYATWCGPCRVMDEKVFSRPDVKETLAQFVVLKVDVDRSTIARAHNVMAMPSYIVYDPGERELLRITGARDYAVFRDVIGQVHAARGGFLDAFVLFADKKDLEGWFKLGNAFLRLRLTENARSAFDKARTVATGQGKHAAACVAEVQSAYTFSLEGNTKKSIKLLRQIVSRPMDNDSAAVAWLLLGDVEALARDSAAARDAYQHVQSVAPPESPARQRATEALAKLQ